MSLEAYGTYLDRRLRIYPRLEAVREMVAVHFGISEAEMMADFRLHAMRPRQIAMWIARCDGATLADIGRVFGQRDHTVRYAVKQIDAQMARDPQFSAMVHGLHEQVSYALLPAEDRA